MTYSPEPINDGIQDWTRLAQQLSRMEQQIAQNSRDIEALGKRKMDANLTGDVGNRYLWAAQTDRDGDNSAYALISTPTELIYRKIDDGAITDKWRFNASKAAGIISKVDRMVFGRVAVDVTANGALAVDVSVPGLKAASSMVFLMLDFWVRPTEMYAQLLQIGDGFFKLRVWNNIANAYSGVPVSWLAII